MSGKTYGPSSGRLTYTIDREDERCILMSGARVIAKEVHPSRANQNFYRLAECWNACEEIADPSVVRELLAYVRSKAELPDACADLLGETEESLREHGRTGLADLLRRCRLEIGTAFNKQFANTTHGFGLAGKEDSPSSEPSGEAS